MDGRDFSVAHSRLPVPRTLQNVGGRPVEFGVKTRTSRRSGELDRATLDELRRWRRQLGRDGPIQIINRPGVDRRRTTSARAGVFTTAPTPRI